MKIVVDVSYLQKKRTGYGHYTTELLNILLKYGTENEYILFGASYKLDRDALLKFKSANVRLNIYNIPGSVKRFYYNKFRYPEISFFLGDFNIFHSVEPLVPPLKNNKLVLTVHDLAFKKFPQYFESHVLRWEKYIARNIESADAIIVQSIQTKNDLVEIFRVEKEKIHLVQLPISVIFNNIRNLEFENLIREKYNLYNPFVLFVGTIEPRKNIPSLIKAFEIIKKTNKIELDLVIVGKAGWKCKEIMNLMAKSEFKNEIKYLNYLEEEHLAAIYRMAMVFVYPSFYEGYGVPVLEAMASGVPVITSDTSSLKEIANGSAILVDPYNIEQIYESILKLYYDTSLRDKFSEAGMRRVKFFDAKTAAEKIFNLYNKIS